MQEMARETKSNAPDCEGSDILIRRHQPLPSQESHQSHHIVTCSSISVTRAAIGERSERVSVTCAKSG